MDWQVRMGVLGTLVLLLGPPAVRPVGAATFVVDDPADEVDATAGDGFCATASGSCTLRAAVIEANALAGADAITLASGTYTLTRSGAGEDAAQTGDLDVTDDLSIAGAGRSDTVIDAGGLDRVLHVVSASAQVSLTGLTLSGGQVLGSGDGLGGGIYNRGLLTLTDVRVTGNTAIGEDDPGGGRAGQGRGGGIYNRGELVAEATRIDDNEARGGSAAPPSWSGSYGRGGGLCNVQAASAQLVRCEIDDNRAIGGMGLHLPGQSSRGAAAFGGGIYNDGAVLRVESSALRANLATGGATEGCPNPTDTCLGYGGGAYGGGAANWDGDLVIESSTFEANRSSGGDALGQGSAGDGYGGGFWTYKSGALPVPVTLRRVTVTGNFVAGGADNPTCASSYCRAGRAFGGGLVSACSNDDWVDCTLEVVESALVGNEASGGSGSSGGEAGGGAITVYNNNTGQRGTVAALTNCTLSGNLAVGGNGAAGRGGAVYGLHWYADLALASSTVVDNRALDDQSAPSTGEGGGLDIDETNGGRFYLTGTIVARNQAAVGPDCSEAGNRIISQGHNLVGEDTDCLLTPAAGDQIGTAASPLDPLVGPLADNGGPTPTHALLGGSPAIDAGDPDDCVDTDGAPLETDQRGVPRPLDGDGDAARVCDTGAYEAGTSLGDRVWFDPDEDGIQDPGEPGAADVEVVLLDELATPVGTARTDADGYYWFGPLAAGSYRIQVIPPAGYWFSPPDQGADDSLDSDVDPANGRSAPLDLLAGESRSGLDAGLMVGSPPPCEVVDIAPIRRLLAVVATDRASVDLTWGVDPQADDGYNVWYVLDRHQVPACQSCPGSQPVPGCTFAGGDELTTWCTHEGAVPGPPATVYYYEVRGVCGGVEAAR